VGEEGISEGLGVQNELDGEIKFREPLKKGVWKRDKRY